MKSGGLIFIETAKIFSDGETQLVALPKNFQIKSREVVVERIRDVLILIPKQRDAADIAATLDLFTDDFMSDEIKEIPPTVSDAATLRKINRH